MLCVFAGSAPGAPREDLALAAAVGAALAGVGVPIVYGGGSTGCMGAMADAFVVLPGGLGTLDELGEVLTWAQLGIHAKPTVLVDPEGYWRPIVEWIDRAVLRGYVSVPARDFLVTVCDAADVLPAVRAFVAPTATRGPLSLDQT